MDRDTYPWIYGLVYALGGLSLVLLLVMPSLLTGVNAAVWAFFSAGAYMERS